MKADPQLPEKQLRVGEISGLHGVQGWIKVFSDTQPRENIFSYKPWFVRNKQGEERQVEVLHWRKQGKTLVAKLKGLENREDARLLMGSAISVKEAQLPHLDKNEYYWHQLVGLTVVSTFGDEPQELGVVAELIETGSNDVMIVRSATKEHLVPWVFGQFVLGVDLDAQRIDVDWDPEF